MTVADLIKDFIDSAKERIKSPISGSFLWSFIIYNWRPVFLLLLSNASVEDKIIVINHEYCNSWAIGGPIIIAFVYTLLVPLIMVLIDKCLTPLKRIRISSIYDSRIYTNEQKMKLAEKEVLLKEIMSGNRSQQELLDRISTLEQSNNERANADKNTIDSLTKNLSDVNAILRSKLNEEQSLQTVMDNSKAKILEDAFVSLGPDFRKVYYDAINSDQKLDLESFPPILMKNFLKLNLFVKEDDRWLLTDLGLRLFNMIDRSLGKNK